MDIGDGGGIDEAKRLERGGGSIVSEMGTFAFISSGGSRWVVDSSSFVRRRLSNRSVSSVIQRRGQAARRAHLVKCVATNQTLSADGAANRVIESGDRVAGQVRQWYRSVPLESGVAEKVAAAIGKDTVQMSREDCFNVQIDGELTEREVRNGVWII